MGGRGREVGPEDERGDAGRGRRRKEAAMRRQTMSAWPGQTAGNRDFIAGK